MEAFLKETLQHCMEMQRLAEAKNAGLVAFNGGMVACMARFCYDSQASNFVRIGCGAVVLAGLVALVFALLALGPKLRHAPLQVLVEPGDNLQYFGCIASYTAPLYLSEVNRRYFGDTCPVGDRDRHSASQVVINAQIALRKFRLFQNAFIATMVGFCVGIAVTVSQLVGMLFR